MNLRASGAGYELLARRHLEHAGLTFCAANVAVRGGELDLIMRDGTTWVFVEVRYRRNDAFGGAAASYLSQTTAVAACRRRLAGGARSQL